MDIIIPRQFFCANTRPSRLEKLGNLFYNIFCDVSPKKKKVESEAPRGIRPGILFSASCGGRRMVLLRCSPKPSGPEAIIRAPDIAINENIRPHRGDCFV